jgi:hypothetical protein
MSLARFGKLRPSWSLSVAATNRLFGPHAQVLHAAFWKILKGILHPRVDAL